MTSHFSVAPAILALSFFVQNPGPTEPVNPGTVLDESVAPGANYDKADFRLWYPNDVSTAPLPLWGMSAGGEFNYEFVAWKPERVVAFVVNKGNIYYTALAPRAARQVPGMLFVGGKDLEFRTNTITGLFAVNRRGGALWALAEEPGAGDVVGRSREVALMFFEDAVAARLDRTGAARAPKPLKPIDEKSGFLGDFKAKTFQPIGRGAAPGGPTAWLLTERVAKAWQAMVTEQPFDR